MNPKFVFIEGWFCVSDKTYPTLGRAVIDGALFKYSCRKFEIGNLHILKTERIVGSFLAPTYVTAVVDTKGSLIPFFIDRQKVKKLQEIISNFKDSANVTL